MTALPNSIANNGANQPHFSLYATKINGLYFAINIEVMRKVLIILILFGSNNALAQECGNIAGASLAQRIADCAANPQIRSQEGDFQLVLRSSRVPEGSNLSRVELWLDRKTNTVWASPDGRFSIPEQARQACEQNINETLVANGLIADFDWRLPSVREYVQIVNDTHSHFLAITPLADGELRNQNRFYATSNANDEGLGIVDFSQVLAPRDPLLNLEELQTSPGTPIFTSPAQIRCISVPGRLIAQIEQISGFSIVSGNETRRSSVRAGANWQLSLIKAGTLEAAEDATCGSDCSAAHHMQAL